MKRLVGFGSQVLALISMALPVSSVARAQNTYYVSSSSGSDSNTASQAQNKATPWAHAPGMTGATGNDASYSPVAGDSIVLKGCDTWTVSGNSPFWNLTHSGSSGNPISYGGLDNTWYNTSV